MMRTMLTPARWRESEEERGKEGRKEGERKGERKKGAGGQGKIGQRESGRGGGLLCPKSDTLSLNP